MMLIMNCIMYYSRIFTRRLSRFTHYSELWTSPICVYFLIDLQAETVRSIELFDNVAQHRQAFSGSCNCTGPGFCTKLSPIARCGANYMTFDPTDDKMIGNKVWRSIFLPKSRFQFMLTGLVNRLMYTKCNLC